MMLYGKDEKRTRKLQIWVTTISWEAAADWQLVKDMLFVSMVLEKVHTLKLQLGFFIFALSKFCFKVKFTCSTLQITGVH